MPDLRASLCADLEHITPLDPAEAAQIASVRAWVLSGAPLLRDKGGEPSPHLVAYCCVTQGDQILLVHHRKADLWLPPGGHVDPGETPVHSARREIREELGADLPLRVPRPLMVTRTTTVGAPPHHEDVTLWYLFQGAQTQQYDWDRREFYALKWWPQTALPPDSDPNLPRFIAHLQNL